MTKLRIIFLIVCIFFLPVRAGEVGKPSLGLQVNWAHPLSDGLVGYWLMNEGSGNRVQDLSGNNNTGVLQATAYLGPAKFGSGLILDGDSDYVTQPMTAPDTEATFVVWAKVNTLGDVLNTFLNDDGAGYFGFGLNDGNKSNDDKWVLSTYSSGSPQILASTDSAVIGRYYQVVGIYGVGGNFLYVDGVLVDSSASEIPDNTATALAIGKWGANYYNGTIDHVLIYNRALSASEIAQLYREPFCMFQRPNIAMWAASAGVTAGWIGIDSSHIDSSCHAGENGHLLTEALDGTDYWEHYILLDPHEFVLDLGSSYNITKVRGRSNTSFDPTDVDIYVSNDTGSWGAAVKDNITTWQDTTSWVEIDTTDKEGRYIKVEVISTEQAGVENQIDWGGTPAFTIFDAYGSGAAAPAVAGQFIFIMMD